MSSPIDLLNAFEQKNFGKFQECLEVYLANPNEFDEITNNRTVFETILSTPKSAEYIKLCLKNDADFYMKNNNGQYPIHCVMESQSLENLMEVEHLFDNIKTDKEDVLKRYSTHVNVKQLHGENSLHILAENITNDNFDVIFSMMKVLLSHGCNANYPNYDGKTAFFIVLEKIPKLKKRKDILDYFLKHVEVDFYSHRSEEIVEMVMNQKLKFELPEREDIDIAFESMMNLLEESEINRFETLFPFFKATCSDTECYQDCCSSFMEVAVKKSLINIVDLLIDYGIEVNRISKKNSSSNVPPAFLTCSDAKPALLKLFLMHPKIKLTYEDENQKRKTLLHQFFDEQKKQTRSAFRRSDTREMTKDQKTCFDLLMSHPKVSLHLINAHDEDGFSAIHYSVKFKNDYVTLQLLKKGAYIGTIINRIRKSVLEEFLNSTLTTNDRFYDDEEFEVKIDYSFLSPPCQYETFKKGRRKAVKKDQTEVAMPKSEENIKILSCDNHEQYSQEVKSLQKLAESTELQHLLSHPTIASFILLKWNKISFLVYINMIIILTFLLSFIPFAYLCQNLPDDEKSTDFFYIFFQIISAISLLCLIIRELTQAALSVRKYIFNYSNWIDISLMAFAITILVFETTIPNHTSRVLRTVVILLATAEYFNLLGMVPILSISIHTKMFKKVCETFIKSLAFYSMMIIAFAFSFYNLQGDKFVKDMNKLRLNGPDNTTNDIPVTNATRNERFNNFYTVGSSILKSFVMLTGELETSYVHTEGWTYAILFMMFLFLVTIVLYNLLNALAVSDTQEIKRDAKLIDLKQRIMTMYESEEAIFRRHSRIGNWLKMVISMFPKTIPEGFIVVKPNRSLRVLIASNKGNPITLNEWLPNKLGFLKQDVQFNIDILQEIYNLLKTRREDQKISELRRLKESRNEKLANDIINVGVLISDIQRNIMNIQADIYAIKGRVNL